MGPQKAIIIVATSFHKKHVDIMLGETRKMCRERKIKITKEVWVPGCLEAPLALQRELRLSKVNGAVVLGIIEKGQTKHGLVMGIAVISEILKIQLKLEKPIGVGILGPEILPGQIKVRLKPYAKDAVLAVETMLNQK